MTPRRSGTMVMMLATMLGAGLCASGPDPEGEEPAGPPPPDDDREAPPPLTWPPPSKGDALLAELRAKSPSRRQREGRDRGRW